MNVPPSFVEKIRVAFNLFDESLGELSDAACVDFSSGSEAEDEHKQAHNRDSLTTATATATLLIEFSSEHMSAFVKTITGDIEPLACWTNVRCMMEACSIASWLLEPKIGYLERTKRVFAHRYEGLTKQKTWAAVAFSDPDQASKVEIRIDKLENDAVCLGIPVIRDRNGRRIGLGCIMPKATDIIGAMLQEEHFYRLASAVAHGHYWATKQLGFRSQEVASIGTSKVVKLQRNVSATNLAYLASRAFFAQVRPILYLHQYMGWDILALEELIENCADTLDIKDNVRFWRHPPVDGE